MRTLTAYGIGVVIVLAILNAIVWPAGTPRLHELNVFSAEFILGMLGDVHFGLGQRISPGHLIGFQTEGHELDRKTEKLTPKAMIGRRLSSS